MPGSGLVTSILRIAIVDRPDWGTWTICRSLSALNEIGYTGYLSAEVFPYPDSLEAAQRTINSFRKYVLKKGD